MDSVLRRHLIELAERVNMYKYTIDMYARELRLKGVSSSNKGLPVETIIVVTKSYVTIRCFYVRVTSIRNLVDIKIPNENNETVLLRYGTRLVDMLNQSLLIHKDKLEYGHMQKITKYIVDVVLTDDNKVLQFTSKGKSTSFVLLHGRYTVCENKGVYQFYKGASLVYATRSLTRDYTKSILENKLYSKVNLIDSLILYIKKWSIKVKGA